MPRTAKIALIVLAVAVVIGVISFSSLRRRVNRLQGQDQTADEKARQAVLAPPISTPTDEEVTATIFWAAGANKIAPVQVQLPLSADPVHRARQVLLALIDNPPTAGQRTLPADTELLGFYVLPDGTAVADFSDALGSETPSGILSEQEAVDSIAQTLASNVPSLRRLKILIHGQEAETLAGHVDLTGFFDLNTSVPSAPTPPQSGAAVNSH
ncbi:MAG TPA: GerMN domain-containing protein [Candidatus Acidoferrales bacterium]|nr:GerMN domain-containing protein [Candidatus Acidoferrales bacterium]